MTYHITYSHDQDLSLLGVKLEVKMMNFSRQPNSFSDQINYLIIIYNVSYLP